MTQTRLLKRETGIVIENNFVRVHKMLRYEKHYNTEKK